MNYILKRSWIGYTKLDYKLILRNVNLVLSGRNT
jgi:hypothetical protein